MMRTGELQAPAEADAFQERKSELRQFVHDTRDRLRMLSEQVALFQRVAPAASDLSGSDWDAEEFGAIQPTKLESVVSNPPSSISTPSEQVDPIQPTRSREQVMPTMPAVQSGSHAADDPLQRLSEIKKRLARQIENA